VPPDCLSPRRSADPAATPAGIPKSPVQFTRKTSRPLPSRSSFHCFPVRSIPHEILAPPLHTFHHGTVPTPPRGVRLPQVLASPHLHHPTVHTRSRHARRSLHPANRLKMSNGKTRSCNSGSTSGRSRDLRRRRHFRCDLRPAVDFRVHRKHAAAQAQPFTHGRQSDSARLPRRVESQSEVLH